MLSRLVAILLGWATGRTTLIAFVALIAGSFLLFRLAPYDAIKALVAGQPLPEEGATYEGGLVSFLRELGEEGRTLYLRFQLLDLLNPVLLGVAFTLLTGWLVKRAQLERRWVRYLVLVPLFVAGADVVENLLLIDAIASFPGAGTGNALAAPVTAAKFIGFVVMMVATALLGLTALIRSLRRKAA